MQLSTGQPVKQRGAGLLVCLPTIVFGGHERMLVRMLHALSTRVAVPIAVVCADVPELLAELRTAPRVEVRISYGPGVGLRAKVLSLAATGRALLSVRGRLVLFAPGSVHNGLYHVLLAKLMGRRVVSYVPMCFPASVLGYRRPPLMDRITRTVGRTVDLWITITRAQQALLRTYFGIRRPIQVVPIAASGVRDGTVVAATRNDGRLQVVFLGRYDAHQKGLDWLCRALRESHGRWKGRMCFHFFGEGGFRRELEQLAAHLGPGEVTVNGWTDSSTALAAADLLLQPSRFEGFPLVFMEAAAAGVPILSTRFPGARKLLGQGAWVDFGDTPTLVSSLLRMTDNTLRREIAALQKASLESQSLPRLFEQAVSELAQRLRAVG